MNLNASDLKCAFLRVGNVMETTIVMMDRTKMIAVMMSFVKTLITYSQLWIPDSKLSIPDTWVSFPDSKPWFVIASRGFRIPTRFRSVDLAAFWIHDFYPIRGFRTSIVLNSGSSLRIPESWFSIPDFGMKCKTIILVMV